MESKNSYISLLNYNCMLRMHERNEGALHGHMASASGGIWLFLTGMGSQPRFSERWSGAGNAPIGRTSCDGTKIDQAKKRERQLARLAGQGQVGPVKRAQRRPSPSGERVRPMIMRRSC